MASQQLKITLFDIPSIARKSWSPNVWKVRLALNYKALPYSTEWLHFSNLSTNMLPYVEPNRPPLSPHTIPCILFQEGETTKGIMGSRAIAEALEKHSNLQPLRLEAKESAKVEQLAEKLLIASRPLWAHLVPKILTESNGEYYSTTRTKRFGMSLDLYYTEHSLAQTPGPYLLGQQPTYADFTVVALIKFFCCVGKAMADHFFLVEPRLRKLYEACYQWFKRDD